jgi:hypothetical protein
MKNLLFIALGLVLISTSCSKQNKVNKAIEGKWNLTQIEGVPTTGFTQTMEFTRIDKSRGDFEAITTPTGLPSQTQAGEYYISDPVNSIGFTFNNGDTESMIMDTQEDNLLVLTSTPDSTTYRFER